MAERRFLQFHSDAEPDDPFHLVSFQGFESISHLFRYEIDLVSLKANVDLAEMLKQPAYLGIIHGVPSTDPEKKSWETLKVHGVLSSFEQLEQGHWVRYRAVLVPALWRLSLNVQSQIHQEKSVPKILEEELTKGGLKKGDDFDFRFSGKRDYEKRKREYVVQYIESDLNFLSRLAEHEGISYFFEHGERAKLLFGDHEGAFRAISGNSTLPYRPVSEARSSGTDWFEPEKILSFRARQSAVPSEVVLRDYNYRTPTDDLQVQKPVKAGAMFGTFYEYGDHYKDKDAGKEYAEIRAQEIQCRQRVFSGSSDARGFRAGGIFTLSEHYRPDFNGNYLITEVWHSGSQPIEHVGTAGGMPVYRNEFLCIPAAEVFRPERITPKPKVWTLNATVDAAGAGKTAEIDEDGRYKVKVPFDRGARDDGKASRFVRMMTPHAGPGEGFHAPLRKGTEVVLTHMNGDPDRPLIEGAACNPTTVNVVTNVNQTQFVWQSYSLNKIVFENREGEERICLSSPKWKSYICIGNKDETEQEGVRVGTEEGISVTAGHDIAIVSGAGDGAVASNALNSEVSKTASNIATVGAFAGMVCATAAEYFAVGHMNWIGFAADAGSMAAGALLHKNIYLQSPAKIAAIAGVEAIVAAGGSVDVMAGGTANIMSLLGTLVLGMKGVTVTAVGPVENVAQLGKVILHAKRNDVRIEAKKNVLVEAEKKNVKIETKTEDIEILAKRNFTIQAHDNGGKIVTKKGLEVEDTEEKYIHVKSGKSDIWVTDEMILMQADSIVLRTNDEKNVLALGKEAEKVPGSGSGFGFVAGTKDKMMITAKGDNAISSVDGKISLMCKKDQLVIRAKEIDEKAPGTVNRKNSSEG